MLPPHTKNYKQNVVEKIETIRLLLGKPLPHTSIHIKAEVILRCLFRGPV